MQRRDFVKAAAAAGTGFSILPGMAAGQKSPSDKLNVAFIGVGGRGTVFWNILQDENVVALCDINELNMGAAARKFPNARRYEDWRECLDQKDIDAVVCCTPDWTHAFIANWALNRGLHIYCEKPLGITVEEARTVRANYVRQRDKVATQHGTQRHAYPNFQRVRELILDGAIGELKTVSAWDSRELGNEGSYPAAAGTKAPHINFDLWLGPSPEHPYNPEYFDVRPGFGCLSWNKYWDFGVGQIGDMGAHVMDLAWNAIDAGFPLSADTDMELSDKFNPDIVPMRLKTVCEHPKNDWRPAIQVAWYQGGLKPESPKGYIDLTRIGDGVLYEGTKGYVLADFGSRVIIPNDSDGDLTYYKRRSEDELLPLIGGTGTPPPTYRGVTRRLADSKIDPRERLRRMMTPERAEGEPARLGLPAGYEPSSGKKDVFMQEWLDACKGMNNRRTSCDFDYAGTMMVNMLLGLVSYRVGQKVEYDAAANRITNVAEANQYLRREYRDGWTLDG